MWSILRDRLATRGISMNEVSLGDDEVEEGEVIDYDVQYLPVSKMGDIYPNSPEYKILQKLMYKMIDSMR